MQQKKGYLKWFEDIKSEAEEISRYDYSVKEDRQKTKRE